MQRAGLPFRLFVLSLRGKAHRCFPEFFAAGFFRRKKGLFGDSRIFTAVVYGLNVVRVNLDKLVTVRFIHGVDHNLVRCAFRVRDGHSFLIIEAWVTLVAVEVGFILGADIPPEGCSQEEAAAAIEWVVPSIELIDSRIKDWKITLGDTIADNASSCGYVVGSGRVRLADIDVAAIEATLYKNGEFLASGRSDAVLGNPLNSVGWLASTVAKFGVRLRKGDVILPGTAIRAMDATPGDAFRADFAGLGSVSMEFR